MSKWERSVKNPRRVLITANENLAVFVEEGNTHLGGGPGST